MYRIDEFIRYYNSLSGTQREISPGCWVNAKPLPYYNMLGDFFTKRYWKERKERKKDAKAVRQGKAVAVTWEDL